MKITTILNVLYDKFWFMQAYIVLSIILAISGAFQIGWTFALCMIGACSLSLTAGGGLKYCLWWGDTVQKIGVPIIIILLMCLTQWLAHSFSLQFFGHYVSGVSWSWLGFVISFVCTDKKLAGITSQNEHSAADMVKNAERGYAWAKEQLANSKGDNLQKAIADNISAYMWLSLLTQERGDMQFVAMKNREQLAARMTPEQIAEAQRLAGEWKQLGQPVANN